MQLLEKQTKSILHDEKMHVICMNAALGTERFTLARLLKTLRQHLDTVMFMVSLEHMVMAVRGSGSIIKSSPGTGLLSRTGLFFIYTQKHMQIMTNRTHCAAHSKNKSQKSRLKNTIIVHMTNKSAIQRESSNNTFGQN